MSVSPDNAQIFSILNEFMAERDWERFHSDENLAKSIAIEAAELLECYQWEPASTTEEVAEELADVLTYCYLLSQKIGFDPHQLMLDKLKITSDKYPINKAKGTSTKYDKF